MINQFDFIVVLNLSFNISECLPRKKIDRLIDSSFKYIYMKKNMTREKNPYGNYLNSMCNVTMMMMMMI